MAAAIVDTPDLIRVEDARSRSAPWRVRVQYVGDNPNNKSGRSRKYWQVTAPSGWKPGDDVEIRWGALGSSGQSQLKPLSKALQRARSKLHKGYSYDGTTGRTQQVTTRATATTKARVKTRSFKDRLLSTTHRQGTQEGVLDLAALHSWTRADVGVDVVQFIPRAEKVNLYVDAENRWWLVAKWPDGVMTYGRLPSG